MTKSKIQSQKTLAEIWKQVPPDYYQKGYLQRIWHSHKISTLKKLLDKKNYPKILDVGCASGMMTVKVSQFLKFKKIIGVDVYKDAIEYGKKQYPHIEFRKADAHRLPFRTNTFDLVICYETMEHVKNPQKVLKEIKKVLKRNGTAAVAMDSGSLLFRIVWWFWEKTKGRVWQNAHLHPINHHGLEKLIQGAGLKIRKKHFSHFGMEVVFVLQKN